ncbi:MAG: hypothetical protein V1744_03040 [Candidatus Altiarchaeota archaeon]
MDGRMWAYQELKFIAANKFRLCVGEMVSGVNSRFHGNVDVRSHQDVERVLKGRNIFNWDERR